MPRRTSPQAPLLPDPVVRRRVVVALLLLTTSPACSSDGRELADPVLPPPTPTTIPATKPATTTPTVAAAVDEPAAENVADPIEESPASAPSSVVFEQLFSPANATAEIVGSGAVADHAVTVDGEPADVRSFVTGDDGTFAARIWIEDEGAHTVCIADTCGRVYTLAPDAETAEEVIAKIEEAIDLAAAVIPHEAWFPEWTIEIGGALSGTGGTTDDENRTVTVYRNRGRSVDDFVRTILHEFGHVADAERLDDETRAEYIELAGFPAGTLWRDPNARGIEDWARQPAEDFAEVLVAVWSDGRWPPRTRESIPDDLLVAATEVAGPGES